MTPIAPVLKRSLVLTGLLLGPGLAATRPVAAAWSLDGTPVCTDPQTQEYPTIVPDGAGGAIIFWEDQRAGSLDVFAQRLDANGATLWSNQGVAVCSAAGDQRELAAAGVAGGGAVVVWTDARNAAGGSHLDIYGQRVDGNGIPQWATNGIPLASSTQSEATPQIIPDFNNGHIGSPGFILAYSRYNAAANNGDYAMQHVSSMGDAFWTNAPVGGLRVSSANNGTIYRMHPSLASDGLSPFPSVIRGAVLAWQEWNPQSGVPAHIQLNRVNSLAAVAWGSSGVALTSTASTQDFPSVANLGIVTVTSWSDSRSGGADIYAQKLDGNGAGQWGGDGLPVCRATGTQANPITIAGNSGSSLIVWKDSRSGEAKLYAQRLDTNGQALWAVDGLPLCGAAGAQSAQRAIADGAGGVIVVWEDHRGGGYDIFAQRIDEAGNLLWGVNAVPVCYRAADQFAPALVGDGSAGAYVTWMDNRTAGTTDIYAVRSYDAVNVTAVPEERPAGFHLALVSRNPGPGPALLSLELPEPAPIEADVFDVQGRRIQGLVAEAPLAAGEHSLRWDGDDDRGVPTPAGLYFVRVRTGAVQRVVRLVRTR